MQQYMTILLPLPRPTEISTQLQSVTMWKPVQWQDELEVQRLTSQVCPVNTLYD